MSNRCYARAGVAAIVIAAAAAGIGTFGFGLLRADEGPKEEKVKFEDFFKDFAKYEKKPIEVEGKIFWQSDDGKFLTLVDPKKPIPEEGPSETVQVDATEKPIAEKLEGQRVRVIGTGSILHDRGGAHGEIKAKQVEKLPPETAAASTGGAVSTDDAAAPGGCEAKAAGGCCKGTAKEMPGCCAKPEQPAPASP